MRARTIVRNALAAVVITVLLTCATAVLAEEAHTDDSGTKMKPQARKPFLVAGKMPHLTGMLKQHWDDPDLELTPEQKEILLVIRKNTMTAVMGLAEELDRLESSLAEQAMAAVPPDQLAPLVDKISDLKTEATMVHLRCIHDTMEILDDRQLTDLLDISGTP
jgi:Spy/CpxP family protein refolding chaperone